MTLLRCRALLVILATALSGCATLTGEATQKVSIQTVDKEGRVVDGMSCRASNASGVFNPMDSMSLRTSSF